MKYCPILIAATMLSTVAFAKDVPTPKPVPAVQTAPQLTSTEKIALESIGKEFQQVQQEGQQVAQKLQSVEQDIAKAHPGYRLDEKTGKLIPASTK